MFISSQWIHLPPFLQPSRGRFWQQMSESESSTRRRGTSLKATLKRSTMVCKPWWFLMKMRGTSSVIQLAHSWTKKHSHNLPEQDERTRESTEQWREFHYDGMHPPHEYNRQSIWDWEEERGEAVSWQEALKEMSSTTWWRFYIQSLTVQQQRHQLQNEVFRLVWFFNPCADDVGFIPSLFGVLKTHKCMYKIIAITFLFNHSFSIELMCVHTSTRGSSPL